MKDLSVLNERRGGKWAHPELVDQYVASNTLSEDGSDPAEDIYYNFDIPFEDRKERVKDSVAFMEKMFQLDENSPSVKRAEIYSVPGCEEEPDTNAEVVVYCPLKESKKKLPAILFAAGSAMYYVMIEPLPGVMLMADRLDCVMICPRYRTSFEGQYPAALNDCHAAYNWAVANADMLNIDPTKIALCGASSGAHLALSLAHRLKRYNQKPCGCVVPCALADNRPMYRNSNITTCWTAADQWKASLQYLGSNNTVFDGEPEMYPMYATPEQCVGLCPTFIHADTEDESADSCREYQSKLTAAGVYNELHSWGGSSHGVMWLSSATDPDIPAVQRYISVFDGNFKDCWKYDMRREWVNDLVKDD